MRFAVGWLFLTAILFSSCKSGTRDENSLQLKNPRIRNGIVVNSKNIKVDEAYLVFDDSNHIPENNKVKVDQKIWLQLVTSGWKLKDSLVYLSGRETVVADDGTQLMDDRDLFKDSWSGFTGGTTQTISMSLIITELRKKYDYFKVSFKLKDEIEPRNTIEGYYRVHPYK